MNHIYIVYVYAVLVVGIAVMTSVLAQHDPHYKCKRSGIVHLFEWKFSDIEKECLQFLGPNGYGGVQVSPVNENVIAEGRAWWERYQPMSYIIETRSGNAAEFARMVKTCRIMGVNVYVDVIANHMAAPGATNPVIGTAGSTADPSERSFPAVPYTTDDFHPYCVISDYQNATEVRICQLNSLPDLNQTRENVRESIVSFMNTLIDLGVAGFRMDACKHMWQDDLEVIYSRLNNLSTKIGFPPGAKPFIYQEVIDLGGEAVSSESYTSLGVVTEFKYSNDIGLVFRGNKSLSELSGWNPPDGFLASQYALVFVDNHDNQRGHGAGGESILTYKLPKLYTAAVAYTLAQEYGVPRVMSSFAFNNSDQGPPADDLGNITSPEFDSLTGQCVNGWVCEHRWPAIVNMIKFREVAAGTSVQNFQITSENQIAFCRGNKAFIAFNGDTENDYTATLTACLPAGVYCDVISGQLENSRCTGSQVRVNSNGKATINIPASGTNMVLAIHAKSKI